ncbi:MAG: YeeE/YedE family protein [Reichenbachiella sp.]
MKFLKYLVTGIVFGIILSKAEVISWYRIYEMFKFQSFHMYGVIGSAVVLGALMIMGIKKFNIHSIQGDPIVISPKEPGFWKTILGGTIFGLGWAMTGACPGPMFILIGQGFLSFVVMILSATLGTFVYGLVRNKLPH